MNSELQATAWQGKAYSRGWTATRGGAYDVIEPATGKVLCQAARARAEDIRQAAKDARAAQAAWAAMPIEERAAIFRRAGALLEHWCEAVLEWIVRETGSVPAKAEFELAYVIGDLHEAAAMLTQPRGLILPSPTGSTSLARRVPHGVVGVISPFNFPLLLSMRAVAPALACGNAVVLKPDPRTPVSGGYLIASLFEAAGLPAGVLHALPGEAEAGEALVRDPDVAMISFTGSTEAGRRVGELAGRHLKKVSLELGGKNALIILDDADLDLAAANGAWASFLHQGQICMAAGRHLVHRKIAAAYLDKLAEKAERLPVGNPHTEQVAIGPLINRRQIERVERIVAESLAAGAKLRAGGIARELFYHPTVLEGVTEAMPAFREEIFGPVAAVTVVDDLDHAIEIANMTEYGLSAAVITRSTGRAMEIADRLDVGLIHVNDQTINAVPYAPFGGRGASGNGSRHGGPANWDDFTQWQWVTIKEAPPRYPF